MSTIVFVHAHPDDEASSTSGAMARAASEGHRVVVVYGTNGDHGEAPPDLAPGESVIDRRRAEAEASARVTGTARLVWLGYADSGMTGWEQNSDAASFHLADLDEAAGRVAAVLDEEDADVVVGYDWHGGYGHPDHVKVHAVTRRAAELAHRRPRLLEATMNRDQMRRMFEAAKAANVPGLDGGGDDWDPDGPGDDGNAIGMPESEIHWAVELGDLVATKRAALACHASQTSDVGMMLSMPPEVFAMAFGSEHYLEPGRPAGMQHAWFLDPQQDQQAATG